MKPGTGYAPETKVPVATTRGEIEDLLRKYKATGFVSGWQDTPAGRKAILGFELQGRSYRIPIPVPQPGDVARRSDGQRLPQEHREAALGKRERQVWREMLLLLKAVLVAVERGIIKPQEALLTWEVMPNGMTVGDWAEPQMEQVYRTGGMPELLPGVDVKALSSGK
jgi:hypothetical protein